MGQRGPKPKATALLKLQGSKQASKRKNEPEVIVDRPECPDWLSASARNHWPKICEMLEQLNVLSKAYLWSLALFVDALADWIDAVEACGANPLVECADDDREPWIHKYKRQAWERVLKIAREFGLTPVAIASAKQVAPKNDKDDPTALTL